jgi:serine/threonine-protein kinase HipA
MIVLNTAVRNGDAHLKNFAVLYDDPQGTLELAPMYDVVTTSAYLPQDQMALTLDGRPNWPNREMLRNLGRTRTNLSESQIGVVLQRTLDAISDTARQMAQYAKDRPEFEETFRRMKSSWDDGARSLTS